MKKAKGAAPSALSTTALDSTGGLDSANPTSAKPPVAPTSATPAGGPKSANAKAKAAQAMMMQSGSASNMVGGSIESMSHSELLEYYQELTHKCEQVGLLQEKLTGSLKRKSESYVRREVQYKSGISHLKESLEKTVLCRGGDEVSMPNIRNLHGQIMANVEEMQNRCKRIVEEHERDLLRQFRSKLVEIDDRMKRDMSKVDDVTGVPRAWIERTTKLSKEVDQHKEQAIRLDRINEVLSRNIAKFRAQCKSQEEDREALVRQLVTIKKDNGRLQREIEKLTDGDHLKSIHKPVASSSTKMVTGGGVVSALRETVHSASRPNTAGSGSGGGGGGGGLDVSIGSGGGGGGGEGTKPVSLALQDAKVEQARYLQVVERLKRLLDQERKSVRDTKASQIRMLAQRTELQGMLREAVDQVKMDLGLGLDPSNMAEMQVFTRHDRERVLENLLSRDRTIVLLYDREDAGGGGLGGKRGGAEGSDQATRVGGAEGLDESYASGLREADDDDDEP